jgi:excisionase family DNA binding protein
VILAAATCTPAIELAYGADPTLLALAKLSLELPSQLLSRAGGHRHKSAGIVAHPRPDCGGCVRSTIIPAFLTPPAVARLLGITDEKVLTWIRSGELRASNIATRPTTRPRYTILRDALEAFLAARQPQPPTPRPPRRRQPAGMVDYLADIS